MKELWVKKTIWRRYLIEDDEIEEAKDTIIFNQNSCEAEELYDKNKEIEYDDEQIFLPLEIDVFGEGYDLASELDEVCIWSYNSDWQNRPHYDTDCLPNRPAIPKDGDFKYCSRCGREIKLTP